MLFCQVDDCEQPHDSHGWCRLHGQRVAAHGDPRADVPAGQLRAEHANPWAGRLDCPKCESSVWTMPHDERRYPGLWVCCQCSYDWSVRPRSDSVR